MKRHCKTRVTVRAIVLVTAKLNKGLEELFIGLTREMMETFPDGGGSKKALSLAAAGPQVDLEGQGANRESGGCGC